MIYGFWQQNDGAKTMNVMNWLCIGVMAALFACADNPGSVNKVGPPEESVDEKPAWKIENGKFYRDGEWVFLKIAKPLRNFADGNAVQQLIGDLDRLKSKRFNVIE